MSNMVMSSVQTGQSWHDGGLFMGMHWLWWGFWLVTIVLLFWGMARVLKDRSTMHQQVAAKQAAEEALRARFAQGEIGEEELARGLEVLRKTTV